MPATSVSIRIRSSRFERLVAGLNAADRLRHFMAKFGTTLAGQKLWTPAEIAILRRFYPDYRRACTALPHRTARAIMSKAARAGITRPLRIWSDDDLKRLKASYCRVAPMHEMMALFPDKTAKQIWHRAAYSGWRRPLRPPKLRNIEAYDAVRMRAFALRLTMRDLAALSGTGNYFLQLPSRTNWKKISKAASLLEGYLSINWSQHETTSLQTSQQ